ncbi:acyltransferase family protein [Nocardiopsis sp. RSe5-2]|uniref:Acyltransferase family protein n=1 Tax=Nocardiopsis endophytica TaxID=3018445 RepID=A0ABT4U149_9ACTN|nr:acyltransferase family protein [Nocardiopsis endophytica]MDA2810229.1 acyltransferase family protein [Nocardiopsis endophytica]
MQSLLADVRGRASSSPRSAAAPAPSAGGHRPEIDGLRAVAVLLVAAYHIWFGRVSGGVDVFLLVSGFLITGSLVRSVERSGGVGAAAFLGRLCARLMPAAALVLASVLAATRFLLPEDRWRDTLSETVAAAAYHLNWHLALDSVDYLSRSGAVSPLQHFWSLSVQGQFYPLWLVLIALSAWAARRAGRTVRAGAAVAVAAVFAASLAYSVYMTRTDQPWAYFDTGARLWELALGGLLFLALPRLDLPRALRVVLGWLGLAALVSCGLLLQVSTEFPGYIALWPTLAAAAVIAAGTSGSRWGADRLLTLRPLRYLGSLSYALYLWHWPVLVFYLHATDRTLASLHGGLAVMVVSVFLAAATTPLADRVVAFSKRRQGDKERRKAEESGKAAEGEEAGAEPGARTRRRLPGPARAAAVGLACLLPVLLAAGAWSLQMDAERRAREALASDPDVYPGAAALADGAAVPDAPVYPPPAEAADDVPVTYDDGCNQTTFDAEVITCAYGSDDPERTIALVGGSHSAHWFPALEEIAAEHDWRIVNIVKGACLFTDAPQTYKGDPYTSCAEWNRGVMAELEEMRPDAVFTTGTTTSIDTSAGYGGEQVVDGYVDRWRELEAMGVEVVAVRDTPRLGFDAVECLGEGTPDECTAPADVSMAPDSPLDGADLPGNVSVLDLNDLLCSGGECPPVIGNVLVYWDSSHIGATYMRTMAPELEERLLAATGW